MKSSKTIFDMGKNLHKSPHYQPKIFFQTIMFSGAAVVLNAFSTTPVGGYTRGTIEMIKKSKIHPRWVIHITGEDIPAFLGHLGCPEGGRGLQEGRYNVKTSTSYTYIGQTSKPDSDRYIFRKVDCCALCKTEIPRTVKYFINMLRVEI